MTVYTSRDEWDTNINSVGGKKDVYLVVSPWSNDPSANSSQGSLTSGVLVNEFEPPDIIVEPSTDGYFYQDRMNLGLINKRANTILTPNSVSTEINNKPTPKNINSTTDYPYDGTGEVPTNVKREPYIAPSRKSFRKGSNKSRVEKYNPGIEGLVGSNLHQETFTQEQTNNFIVVILTLLMVCFIFVIFMGLGFAYYHLTKDKCTTQQ